MAGFYADVPAPRIPYDRDGSIGFREANGSHSSYNPNSGTIRGMNDEGENVVIGLGVTGGVPVYCGVVFPQPRDVRGLYVHYNDPSSLSLQYSTNTTNGIDGNWSSIPGASYVDGVTKTSFRSNISTVNIDSVLGIRTRRPNGFGGSNGLVSMHIYGSYASGENIDRLRPWHPTLDEPLDEPNSADGAWLDFGDVPRATNADRTFRIKNNSATLTANTIDVSTTMLTDGSPSIPPQFTFSNGGAFATNIDIGTLNPGQISPVITIRRTTPTNAALGAWTTYIIANPLSWS